MADGSCTFCGKKGHFAKDCYAKKKAAETTAKPAEVKKVSGEKKKVNQISKDEKDHYGHQEALKEVLQCLQLT